MGTRITTVLAAVVLLEVPDRSTREVIEGRRVDPITTALSQLANGYIVVLTKVRGGEPDPDPGWLAAAAKALRPRT